MPFGRREYELLVTLVLALCITIQVASRGKCGGFFLHFYCEVISTHVTCPIFYCILNSLELEIGNMAISTSDEPMKEDFAPSIQVTMVLSRLSMPRDGVLTEMG